MIKRRENLGFTIEEAFRIFIREKDLKGLSGKTIENYDDSINHLSYALKMPLKLNLDTINEETIYSYIEWMKKHNYSRCSINHYLSNIRVFLYWCMKGCQLEKFDITLIKGQEERLKYVSESDIEKLLIKPSKSDSFTTWRTYAIVCFIMATGARASTICNIKLEDIDLVNREVTYRYLKNKQIAVIPLSLSLVEVLQNYLKLWNIDSEWLFCDIGGKQLTLSALEQGLNRYCKLRGLKRVNPHSLRHSFSRGWIKNGGNAFTLQQMLTHSDITMTRKYVKLFSNDLKTNFESYNPLDNMKPHNSRTLRIKRK